MRLLNEHIRIEPQSIIFCYPLVEIPIKKDGTICSEEEAEDSAFSTIAFLKQKTEFVVLEFDKKIKHALLGYKRRYGKLRDLEIFVFADPDDGRLRITMGKHHPNAEMPFDETIEETYMQELHKLYNVYMNQHGEKISGRGNNE